MELDELRELRISLEELIDVRTARLLQDGDRGRLSVGEVPHLGDLESQTLAHPAPLDAEAIARWIESLPMTANSGDVYASRDAASLRSAGEPASAS